MLIASSSLELLKIILSNNISEFIKFTPPYNIKSFNFGEDKFLNIKFLNSNLLPIKIKEPVPSLYKFVLGYFYYFQIYFDPL